ncbi:MAG: hypothetical protein KDC80_13615 [Saprospiraceae bacterium]|nr:hypothetical protein [Saprospiraceae bacterium]
MRLLEVSGLGIDVNLRAKDLQYLISKSLQNIGSQEFVIQIPVLGAIKACIEDISIEDLKIVGNQLDIVQILNLNIIPDSKLIPSFSGTIQVKSLLSLEKSHELKVGFKVRQIEWLKGPQSGKGRHLSLIRRLSKSLLKQTDMLERMIESRIKIELAPASIKSRLKQFKSSFPMRGKPVRISDFGLRDWNIHIRGEQMEIFCQVDLYLEEGSAGTTNIRVEEQEVLPDTRLKISQGLINSFLRDEIESLNKQVGALQLDKVWTEIKDDRIIVWLLPRQLNKPIRLDLSLQYLENGSLLTSVDCAVKSGDESGLLVKALLRLFSGKIEDVIENYFPIKVEVLIEKIQDQLVKEGVPFSVSLDDLAVRELQHIDQNIEILSVGSFRIHLPQGLS